MEIVDVNLSIGKSNESGVTIDAGHIETFMKDFCITHAVCYHYHAMLDPKDGNAKIKNIADASNGKIGACVVLDPILGAENLQGSGNLTERLLKFSPEAIRIFPSECRVPFHPFYWKEILDAAKECKLPIIIDENYSMEFFYHLPEVLASCPENKFIFTRQGICESRRIIPILKEFENAYFTVERMADNEEIEEMTELFDCRGLLFGSDYPHRRIEGSLGLVLFADITPVQRERILYKNWEEISK